MPASNRPTSMSTPASAAPGGAKQDHAAQAGSNTADDRSRRRSKLAGSLRRLHAAIHSTTNNSPRTEDPFAEWQRRWSDYGEQISQRLTLIDAQLEQFVSNPRQKPQLAVMSEQSGSDVSS